MLFENTARAMGDAKAAHQAAARRQLHARRSGLRGRSREGARARNNRELVDWYRLMLAALPAASIGTVPVLGGRSAATGGMT